MTRYHKRFADVDALITDLYRLGFELDAELVEERAEADNYYLPNERDALIEDYERLIQELDARTNEIIIKRIKRPVVVLEGAGWDIRLEV